MEEVRGSSPLLPTNEKIATFVVAIFSLVRKGPSTPIAIAIGVRKFCGLNPQNLTEPF